MKRRVHPHEKTGELNIVPYLDIMVNLTMFMLVSMTSVIQFGILNVAAPNYGPAPAAQQQQQQNDLKKRELLLSVAISTKGFFVAGAGGVMGQASDPNAPPPDPKTAAPTIPLLPDGKYDFVQLTRKLVDVKNAFPDESKVILMADQTVPYETLVQTMDAVREDGQRRLFYDVVLGAL
jgi:biopolymer transport protein TolR